MSPRGAKRRLAALDRDLGPDRVVLRWLAEVKAHGSMAAYTAALANRPGGLQPCDRFFDLLELALDTLARDRSRADNGAARLRAARHAYFRYCLVMRLNIHLGERGPFLLAMALANSYHLDALRAGRSGLAAPQDHNDSEGWQSWRERSEQILTESYASRFTRVSLEERFLDRVGSVFPDLDRDCSTATELTELTTKVGLAASATPDRDALAEFRDVDLQRILTAALARATDLAGTIIDGARADLTTVMGRA